MLRVFNVISFSDLSLENIMLRIVGGVFAASLAAPYLASLFIFVLIPVFGASTGANLVLGPLPHIEELLDLLKFLVIGTLGTAIFGLPILIAAASLAFLLHILDLRSKLHAIASGGGLGCLAVVLLFVRDRDDVWVFPLAGALSGAICGWIYWRIAYSGTRSHPQDEPVTGP
ncbi:hypothetical protein MAE02_38950 [Microvirga aerophila]|uniref:Uncharacterized protein n=2 Tax=Microvirga aerophila TaxID=670291 RepID=A0A512BW58_9HYPH|nr:hypothetical protein MAE02_38950 [Microvirga aerophila]